MVLRWRRLVYRVFDSYGLSFFLADGKTGIYTLTHWVVDAQQSTEIIL